MEEMGVANYILQVIMNDHLVFKYTAFLFALTLVLYILFSVVYKYEHMKALTISYDITCPVALSFLSYHGVCLWFGLIGNAPLVSEGPYMENEKIQNCIILPMICYQFWNLITNLLIDEYRTTFAIVHHIVTIAVGVLALYPLWLYYLTYFFGFTEVSTFFFCLSILSKRFKEFHEKYSLITSICDGLFVLSFFAFRIFYYFYIIVDYWKESWQEMMKNDHRFGMHAFIFFCTLIITLLQLCFSKQIIDEIKNLMQGRDKNKDKLQ